MEPETFIAAHCRRLWRDGGEILALKEKSNYDCVFWQEGCTVYQVRPLQCRTYPFWSRILASRAAWDAEAAECPGMNHGELHSADEIRSLQF
jgi:Fe-S-cluster containining protein